MGNEAINIFRKVLDDSDSILKDIRIEVFEKLEHQQYADVDLFHQSELWH